MRFRSGQSGTVVRKGRMWHGRYYVDVPGEEKRRKASVPLGSVKEMKKTEAKRKLRALLEEMGLNADSHLERAVAGAKTFATESAWWKENKLSLHRPSVQETMGSHVDKYLLPRLGSLALAAIDERRVQELITDLTRSTYKWPNGVSKKLSPKTIRNIIGVLKLILGEKVWRDWQLTLPAIPEKEQRFFTPEEMRQIVDAAKGQWKPLFALLAGSGMRCGELFGLHVEDLDLNNGKITIRRSVRNGEEGPLKTKKGYRKVNVEPEVCAMLAVHLNGRTMGRVFQTRNGTPFCRGNVRRKLRQILKSLNLAPGGLHSFRHGCVSFLRQNGVPDDLVKEWVGHSNLETTSRYTHFQDDFRKRIASEVGIFAQTTASQLRVSPNSPNFGSVAVSEGAA